jgi:hypothetical protein
MFKKVEYSGFEGRADLKSTAEQLTNVLAGEIHRWRDDVEVRWSPDPGDPSATLTLDMSLTLPNGIAESAFGTFLPKDREEDWLIRSRCRSIWSNLLGGLLKKQDERVKEFLFESAEA